MRKSAVILSLVAFGAFLPAVASAQPVGAPEDLVTPAADAGAATDTGTTDIEVTPDADAGSTDEANAGPLVPDPNKDLPQDFDEAFDLGKKMVEAAQASNWIAFAGFLIMLLLFIANRLGLRKRVGPKVYPWLAAGLGILLAIGVQLAVPGIGVGTALLQGFLAGASAVGFWELVFKNIAPTKKE